MSSDTVILFSTRFLRLFAYGALSVILVLYLTGLGFNERQTGLLLTCTLLGDTVISLALTTQADRFGRRRTLIIGALLMAGAGVIFASSTTFFVLLAAATIGVISPSGNEVGPFLPIEQAALSQVVQDKMRTQVFAWYTLAGAFATAVGALTAGILGDARAVLQCYIAAGILLALAFLLLGKNTEVQGEAHPSRIGLGESKSKVLKLSALFALDAFGGGFVVQSFVAYWFHLRFHADAPTLGGIFFGANVLAGLSALLAGWIAKRIGLIRTMVFTHLPSNILLILVPLMPTLELASLLLFARFSISQMDVPTRQSYTMGIVRPEERSAAAGITGVARTIGAAIAPMFAGYLFSIPHLINWPFYLAGGLKIVYDLWLYRSFVSMRAQGETHA